MKKEVRKRLEQKYGENFKVYYDGYSYVLKTYQYQAAPRGKKTLLFTGTHDKTFSHFSDAYTGACVSSKFAEYVKKEIEKYTPRAFVYGRFGSEEIPREDSTIDVSTIDAEKLFLSEAEKSIDITCFLFQTLNETSKESLLQGIYNILSIIKTPKETDVSVELVFFNSEFLKEYTFSAFDYNPEKQSIPHIPPECEKFVTHKLFLYFNTAEPYVDFTLDSLYQYTSALTPGGSLGVPPTNLNEIYEKRQKGE